MNKSKVSRVFDLAKQNKDQKSVSSTNSGLSSESSVNNETPGICPKCGKNMSIVGANTYTRGELQTYYCEPCCVATPIQE